MSRDFCSECGVENGCLKCQVLEIDKQQLMDWSIFYMSIASTLGRIVVSHYEELTEDEQGFVHTMDVGIPMPDIPQCIYDMMDDDEKEIINNFKRKKYD